MSQNGNTPGKKPLEKQAANKRNEKGQFVKGNNEGPRFPLGESGNPKGRPPKYENLTSIYKQRLGEKCSMVDDGRTWGEVIADYTMRNAVKGNGTAIKEVHDRIDGKVTQGVELTGKGGGAVRIYNLPDNKRLKSQRTNGAKT